MRYLFPKPMYEQQKKDIKKVFDYTEFLYQQPRDSNQDNQAFLDICRLLGEILNKY